MEKKLIITNNLSELERLVLFLDELQAEWNIPAHLMPSINLVLEEALTNVIFYAYEKGQTDRIKITFRLIGTQLTLVVADRGRPYDSTQKEDPDIKLSAEDRPIGGLGIFLIKQIMDEVSYQRKGGQNLLKMVKHWNETK